MKQKILLTEEQRRTLHTQLRKEKDSRLNDRIKCILLLDKGWTYEKIHEALFLDEATVGRYKLAFVEEGLEGLLKLNHKGRLSRLSKKQEDELSKHLREKIYPNAAVVAFYIKENWDVDYTPKGVTDLLHRLGFSYKKPKKIPAKIDIPAQEKFLEEISKIAGTILYIDAVHPQHNSRPSYGWFPKDEEVAILSNSGRQRVNIHGALNPKTLEIIAIESESIDAFSAVELLETIRRTYPDEQEITVVSDNAKYYHSVLVKKYLENTNINLKFLPPYSPNLNPIERIWRLMHMEATSNKYHEKFKNFRKSIREFFVGAHKIKGKIKSIIQNISVFKSPQIILR